MCATLEETPTHAVGLSNSLCPSDVHAITIYNVKPFTLTTLGHTHGCPVTKAADIAEQYGKQWATGRHVYPITASHLLDIRIDDISCPESTGPVLLAHLAILLKAVSHFSTIYFSDIDICSLVTSYEHEARKKALSAFYIAHGILLEYAVKGILSSSLPLLSLPRRFQAAPQFLPSSVDRVSTKSISRSFRRSLTYTVHSSSLSSPQPSTRSFSHLHQLRKVPLFTSMA